MPTYRTFQTNFASGILDDLMLSRSDTKAYDSGAERLTNWWPLVQGGVRRRPGTLFLGDLTEDYRLIPFEFDDSQRYVVCIGEQKLLIVPIDSGGFASAVSITSGVPWGLADYGELRYVSYGDIIIFTHKDHPMKILRRTGATAFQIEDFEWEEDASGWPKYRPFYAFQAAGVTLTPSGKTGTVHLDTSSAYWNAGHVGSIIRYKKKQIEVTEYLTDTRVVGEVRQILDSAIQLTVTSTSGYTLGETIYGVTSGAKGTLVVVDSSTLMTVDMQSGTFAPTEDVTGLTTNTETSCTAANPVDPVATFDWDEELISSFRGYPSACTLHQQRLFIGGTTSVPLFLGGSKTGALFNFDTGTGLDNESIQYVIASSNGGRIRSLESGSHLQIFSDQKEYYCPESNELPLTPGTMSVRRITKFGSGDAQPVNMDNTTLFVQKNGKVVRELAWNEIEQTYDAPSVSLPSTMYLSGIKETSVIHGGYDQPEKLSFFLNDNGTIAVFHSAKNEGIAGWHYWETNGEFRSLCVMSERIYAVAKRNIGGSDKYYLEEFDFNSLMDSAVFVEEPADTSIFSGFAHLSNQLVDVNLSHDEGGTWRDNAYYLEQFTCNASGQIDISDPNNYIGKRICAGLKFSSPLSPMPAEKIFQDGSRMGEIKTIISATVMLKDSVSMDVSGYDLITRGVTDDLSEPPPLVSGLHEFYLLGWSRKAQVNIVCDIPLPCTILGIYLRVEF